MRFYVSPDLIFPDKNIIEVKDKAEVHHIRDVMRLKNGDVVNVFDGQGNEFSCCIEDIKRDMIVIKIKDKLVPERGMAFDITLYQAIPKKTKMDFIVEKCVELGAARIVPVITDRTVPDARGFTKKAERWRRIGMASSKQCGRCRLPAISDVMDFDSALIDSKQNDLVIFAALDRDAQPLKAILHAIASQATFASHLAMTSPETQPVGEGLKPSPTKNIAVFVGPEGDFSPREISMARETGCSLCSLGSLVLKSETAAIYILSCLSYESQ